MAKPRIGQYNCLGTIVIGLVLVSSGISTLFAQGPMNYSGPSMWGSPSPPLSASGTPIAYDPSFMSDQALMAAGYQTDPAATNFAAWPHYQASMGFDPGVEMASFQQPVGGYPAMQQQPYVMDPAANPYQQTSLVNEIFGDPGQDQSVPTLSHSGGTHGRYSVFARPDPHNPSGGARFNPFTPSWLKNFEAGVYVNDDQFVLTAGGVISLYEAPIGTLAIRALGTAVYHSNGPNEQGVVLDMWYARRMRLLGSDHLIKVGGFYDRQDVLQRYGITTGGILFADVAHLPPTFDIAIGHGTGAAILGNQYREVAEVDVQARLGFALPGNVRCGATVQLWQWDNPILEDNIASLGGYAQFDMGPFLVNVDVTAGKNDVRGFVNLTWEPGRLWNRMRGCDTVNVASTDTSGRFTSWMTQPVMRDLAFRTGDKASNQQQNVVGLINAVSCTVRLNDEVTADGILEAGETFDVDFSFTNNQLATSQNVSATGIGGGGTVTLSGTAATTQVGLLGTTSVNVAGNSTVTTPITEALVVQVDAAAVAGQTVFFDFEVTADGRRSLFRCGAVVVGQAAPGTQQATLLQQIQ